MTINRERLREIAAWTTPRPMELREWEDLLSLADDGLTFRLLNEQGHVVEFTPSGYGLEHPVKCRIEGRLLDCPVQVEIAKLHDNPFGEFGRYRVIIGEAGVLEGWKLPAGDPA